MQDHQHGDRSSAVTRYLTAGYVRKEGEGPLSITEVDDTSITIVTVLYGGDAIRAKLAAGVTVQSIVNESKKLQSTVVQFPVTSLRELSWFEGRNDVVVTYDREGKTKKTTTYISSPIERVALLESLQTRFTQPFRIEQVRPRILQVAWSNILGAVISIVGTVWLYIVWDPAEIGRVRNGRLALAIGREGCAAMGIAFFVGCCVCGWLAVKKHCWQFRCHVE